MAHFELWERDTLNQFAAEATRKLLENEAEIARLRKVADAANYAHMVLDTAKEWIGYEWRYLPLSSTKCRMVVEKIEAALAPNGTKLTGAPHNERNDSDEH